MKFRLSYQIPHTPEAKWRKNVAMLIAAIVNAVSLLCRVASKSGTDHRSWEPNLLLSLQNTRCLSVWLCHPLAYIADIITCADIKSQSLRRTESPACIRHPLWSSIAAPTAHESDAFSWPLCSFFSNIKFKTAEEL